EYGWPRMWKELVARGVRVGKERVRKLMAQHGIRARHKRKYIATSNSNHDLPVAPNLLERNFTATAPNQVWTSDITYCATAEGWVYLAVSRIGVIEPGMIGVMRPPETAPKRDFEGSQECCFLPDLAMTFS